MTALPVTLTVAGKRVLVVGGGRAAVIKLRPLLEAGARVRVVAPRIDVEIERAGVALVRRPFEDSDLDGCWFAIAASTPEVNRQVASAADFRRIFLDSSDGAERASGLEALLRQALQRLLPDQLGEWLAAAECLRGLWRQHGVAVEERRPLLLQALRDVYRAGAA